jgi:hypothetical protein
MSRLVDRAITELRENKRSEIATQDSRLLAVLRDTSPNSWDVCLFDSSQIMGYAVIEKRQEGFYCLSLAIGLALRDFLEDIKIKNFLVVARGLGDKARFYRRFGFRVRSYNLGGATPYRAGKYTKEFVPDIFILPPTTEEAQT